MNSDTLSVLPWLDDSDIEDIVLLSTRVRHKVAVSKTPFKFEVLQDEYCYLNFRFHKDDILKLKELLRVPSTLRCHTYRVTGTEALCVLLRRLAYPNRYIDLMTLFGRSRSELCHIFQTMISFMKANWGHLIENGLNHPYVTIQKMKEYADVIHEKGAPYRYCVGFLDGTVRPTCRPTQNQKLFYNGHKRTHGLKFQSVVFPDGIIASMFGPIRGRRHDAFILDKSHVTDCLEQRYFAADGTPFHLYGDPAYPLLRHIIVPFKGQNLTRNKQLCNSRMSQVRECVEWQFGKIVTNFAFLDFKKNLKLELQPVADFYKVGTILTNCHTCLYGSQTSDYFITDPPTIETYLMMF